MKFEINSDIVYFIKDDTKYTLPDEDLQRLVTRPSTRVLRIIDETGEITSTPLSTAVGEIEGYQLLIDTASKE